VAQGQGQSGGGEEEEEEGGALSREPENGNGGARGRRERRRTSRRGESAALIEGKSMAFLIPPVRGNQSESNSVSALANDALASPRRMPMYVFVDNCDEAMTRLVPQSRKRAEIAASPEFSSRR